MNYKKEFNIGEHDANTLPTSCIGDNESGWKVSGDIHEDYYKWVNEFEAIHEKFGKVWGNFEKTVYADSKKGYTNFIKNHPPKKFNYWDI